MEAAAGDTPDDARSAAPPPPAPGRAPTRPVPPGIFVVGCESQASLLRAVLVGPEGTPYADVPFVFDVCLGGGYPEQVPHNFTALRVIIRVMGY